jgi:hypothetical protein
MQNRPEVAFSSAGGLKILSEIYKIKKRGLLHVTHLEIM